MKKTLFLFLLLSIVLNAEAKAKTDFKTVRISYQTAFNGKIDKDSKTIMEISGNIARISTESTRTKADDPVKTSYVDYNTNQEITTALLPDKERIYTTRSFSINQKLTPVDGNEKIAGYNCKKAKTIINSNTIEIWYTTELGVYGSMQPATAIPDGVVLKIVRNGQREEVATKVELLKKETNLAPILEGEQLSPAAFNYKIQQSKVIAVKVFDHEQVYFRDIPKVTTLEDNKVMRFANGSIILKKVSLPKDNKGYDIFAELSQYAEGDAYDRTGSVFIIPTNKPNSFLDGLLSGKDNLPQYLDKMGEKYQGIVVTDSYDPPIELMRFYTSFGVRGYNHIEVADYNWPDSVIFKQEITDYAQNLQGDVWVGAWIGNYAHEGHNITLNIKYYPGSDKKTQKTIYPLFTTTNIMEMAGQTYPEGIFRNDSLTVNFTTDTDLKDAYIRYTSTGHGGWGGGDEFNPKLNEVFLDNHRLIAYTPWREDCGSYRGLNPASGNFNNGLSSSDLSRSGWCPGTVSYPIIIHIGELKAGDHQLNVAIPVGDPEGSSHSYWCISGVLVGDQK